MKLILILLCLAVPAVAQNLGSAALKASCGPITANYIVSGGDLPGAPVNADPSTATVVIVAKAIGGYWHCGQVTRFGMDGKWRGALCLGQHMTTQVEPGDHHLCVDLQEKGAPATTGLHSLRAEAGKVYYFQASAIAGVTYTQEYPIMLEALDKDEGELLYGITRTAVSRPK